LTSWGGRLLHAKAASGPWRWLIVFIREMRHQKNENKEGNVSITDNEARSRNDCYRRKAISITYSD